MPDLTVVVCTLNEARAIGGVLDGLAAALAGVAHEVIVVDDGSTDGTAEAVSSRPSVRLIVRPRERGLASAAIRGWDEGEGAWLAILDGDGQHDPALVRALYDDAVSGGLDLAVGCRRLADGDSGLSPLRARLSRLGVAGINAVLGAPVSDPLSGLFVMSRPWYEAARPRLSAVGFKILLDLIGSSPTLPRAAERPIRLRPRVGGRSKLDARVVFEAAALLVEKRTGGVLGARLLLFAGVGASGLLVHMAVLGVARLVLGAPVLAAQIVATGVAMTSNYGLNNLLTYRDRRLTGGAFWRGLAAFYAACSSGAVVSAGAAAGLDRIGAPWWAAGLAGAVLGGLWNYAVSRGLVWSAARQGST